MPKKVRGLPLQRTDAQLEQISQVTMMDIEAAKALVERASPLLARLLEAEML